MLSEEYLYRYYINAHCDRPDFRWVVNFLYADLTKIDTDGDSHDPACRTWTWLSIRRRDIESKEVEIYPAKLSPLVLVIESATKSLAAQAAYYLTKSMNTSVSLTEDGPPIEFATIEQAIGKDFDLVDAMRRAQASTLATATQDAFIHEKQ